MNKHDPAAVRQGAVFKSNRSQAVRIPKDLAFADGVKRVTIEPTEDGGLLIRPVKDAAEAWRAYLRNGPFLTEDFDPNIPDPPPSDDIVLDD